LETKDEPVTRLEARMPGIYRGVVSVAAAVIVFWGVRSLSFILAPLLMAMVITIAVVPLPGRLMKRGMKSGMALVLTILTVVGVLALTFFVVVGSLGKLSGLLPTYSADFSARFLPLDSSTGVSSTSALTGTLATATATTEPANTGIEALQSALANIPSVKSVVSPQQVSSVTAAVIVAIGQAIAQLFMVLFIFGFMLSAALSMRGRTVAGFSENSPGMRSFQNFTLEVREYVNLMTRVNLMVAVGDTILLWLLGIPSALLWGFLAFLMGYIPAVGWWISLIPPFFLAWAEFGLGKALVVFVAYILINGGVQNIVQPRIMGRGLSISPLVVFVSVIVWTTVLGWMGALISVPLTLIVLKLLESSESTRWMAAIMRIGSGTEEEESKEAVERLKRFTGSWRDGGPFSTQKNPDAQANGNGAAPPVDAREGAERTV
jgi:predicted PurR-regulated permease PerM